MRIVIYDIKSSVFNERSIPFMAYTFYYIFHRRLNEEGIIQPSLEDFNKYLKYLEAKNQLAKFSNPEVTVVVEYE